MCGSKISFVQKSLTGGFSPKKLSYQSNQSKANSIQDDTGHQDINTE